MASRQHTGSKSQPRYQPYRSRRLELIECQLLAGIEIYCLGTRSPKKGTRVSDYKRIALFGSGLLAGIAAFLMITGNKSSGGSESNAGRRRRRGEQPHVEELAEELKHAWEGHHTP
jgi:hypothetical protein